MISFGVVSPLSLPYPVLFSFFLSVQLFTRAWKATSLKSHYSKFFPHWFSHGTFCRIGWSYRARCKQKWKSTPQGTNSLAAGQSCSAMKHRRGSRTHLGWVINDILDSVVAMHYNWRTIVIDRFICRARLTARWWSRDSGTKRRINQERFHNYLMFMWSIPNFPCSLTRNITSHRYGKLCFPCLLSMITEPILTA